jgi:putative CocE/NonD family hydrolase
MIVAVGASDYFSSSMRHNGTLEQRFLIYAYRMATTSPEAKADPALGAALLNIFENGMPEVVENFPILKDTSILRRVPTVEQWVVDLQTVGERTDYWKQRGYAPVEYYDEHADVPTLYLGGWYDSYARNSTECYMKLSRLKDSPQRLLMGPWTHGQYEITHSGDIDFGLTAHIDYNDLKLAWFDHYLKGMRTEVADWSPVRYFTMGGGDGRINDEHRLNHGGFWTGADDWPVPGTRFVPFYIHGDGTLSRKQPGSEENSCTSYVFDPSDPVPTIGGGISAANPIMEPGAYDQRGDPTRFYGTEDHQPLNARPDVLTFQTPPLETDVEVTGPITVRLWAESSAVDTDFTAKLIDVYPPASEYPEGLAINITDSIIRARYRNGYDEPEFMEPGEVYEYEFELYPTSNTFAAGHRIRLDISSSNWPRFDVNHNTGQPLGVDRTYETAHQTVHHSPGRSTHIVLPVAT